MRQVLWVSVALAAATVGCGDDDDGPLKAGPGVVTEAWAGHCQATFTADHRVVDPFGDPAFTIKAGEVYLLGRHDSLGTSILYLTPAGPIDYDIEYEGDAPFESNCAAGEGERRLGVFAETVLYRDEGLRDEICRVAPNQVLPVGDRSASLTSGLFDDPAIYRVMESSLADLCGGETEGYLKAPFVLHGGTHHAVEPMDTFLTVPTAE